MRMTRRCEDVGVEMFGEDAQMRVAKNCSTGSNSCGCFSTLFRLFS